MSSFVVNPEKDDLESSMAASVEISMLTIDECFVYKVPPLRSASGHRAEDWNLANPLFTGCLKVFQAGNRLRVAIYAFKDPLKTSVTEENIQQFGECPIEVKPGETIISFVDGVIDSSRYYVVRIKDPNSSRTTLVGVGFRDREPAFDLKNCLNDYVKFINRMELASQLASSTWGDDVAIRDKTNEISNDQQLDGKENANDREGYTATASGGSIQVQPTAHYSHITPLKDGEKIKVNMKKASTTASSSSSSSSRVGGKAKAGGGGGGGGGFLLKPPPPPGSVVGTPSTSTGTTSVPTTCTGTTAVSVGSNDSSSDSTGTGTGTGSSAPGAASTSTCISGNNEVEDDDWGDFSAASIS